MNFLYYVIDQIFQSIRGWITSLPTGPLYNDTIQQLKQYYSNATKDRSLDILVTNLIQLFIVLDASLSDIAKLYCLQKSHLPQ